MAAAVTMGVALSGATAASASDLDSIGATAAGLAVGDIMAPTGLTGQAVTAAWNAHIPIYAVVSMQNRKYPRGTMQIIEYRRVRSFDDLGTGYTKFIGFGAEAPDTFWMGRGGTILVNMREYHPENLASSWPIFDKTSQKFLQSPLVQLPDNGPAVGVSFIR
ncbi:hypothetical protein [Rhodococcus kronopolitis]|uniref:Uncharacterized protein n=1 Tax=Rhodococcus kronopolitis TaxID=1460226 RepID=A0ABV9FT82_9NOCA